MLTTAVAAIAATASARETYNFNFGWTINNEQAVTLPRAWNEYAAFAVECNDMPDSVMWYRKTFKLPKMEKGSKVLIEFEGAKQAAEVYVNGNKVGLHEDGVMAFGYDITPYIKNGENKIEVMTDNDINYHEKATKSPFQWNYNNFNCNYGGITKNVKLHIVPAVHQTLPLYNGLGTTGQYIYGSEYDIPGHSCTVNVETQVNNTSKKTVKGALKVVIEEMDGRKVAEFTGAEAKIEPGAKTILKASQKVGNLHFWSWGYGYLYKVKTIVGNDTVSTTTGFRKAEFKNGMTYLNDRVIDMHGYAQRSTNEWPAVGNAEPAWMNDFSNNLQVESGGNLVRWMHITPSKQDIESCDRVGLIQAMPAGDSEKDVEGRRWEQRKEVMRDAIIYNRNNPSILFYECGNNNISDEHMAEMKVFKEQYDPNGMRAIGCRNMLSTKVAEYGGEMLYINKSDGIPMWQMEYCRDEGVRKHWNSWSYPFHKEGDGPLYRNAPAPSYNHNMDELAVEFVKRWYDYYVERPGQGTKVNGGGTKIIFSDSQSHSRGETNYRTSGVTDAMRIPKDAFFTHQAMWSGWVEDEQPMTYIMGHWNYEAGTIIPRIYVVSNCDTVILKVNGEDTKVIPTHSHRYLWTFENVKYYAGNITAEGKGFKTLDPSVKGVVANTAYAKIETAGPAKSLRLTKIENPLGWKADGADVAMVQIEAVDAQGRRCPLADDMITFSVDGEAEYLGGVANGRKDNYARSKDLPLNCGVNRVMLRSTTKAGQVTLRAKSQNIGDAAITFVTAPVKVSDGLSKYFPAEGLYGKYMRNDLTVKGSLRGETPEGQSFTQTLRNVKILSAEAAVNNDKVNLSFDNDESTKWESDSHLENSWIKYTLAEDTPLECICLKMMGFRSKAYPIEVYAGDELVWKGYTPKSLSYVRLPLQKKVRSNTYLIKMTGQTIDGDAFGQVKEMEKQNNEAKITGRNALRILEVEFITKK